MRHDIKHISIIGFGNIGRAIQKLLEGKRVAVETWDKEPDRCTIDKPLDDMVRDSEILFLGVPSFAFREAMQNIKPCLSPETAVLSLTKGLEAETGKSSAEVMAEVLGERSRWGIIGGPMLSKEILEGKEAFATVASEKREVFEEASELFYGTKLIVEYSGDPKGIALAGVLKNVYALALGVISALQAGYNVKGEVAKESLNEMSEIIGLLGGRRESVMTSAALADFIATGFSPLSRNFTAGEEIVRTGKYCYVPEGVFSLRPLSKRLGRDAEKLPLLRAIYKVFCNSASPQIILKTLLKVGGKN